jgi:hypothetical protein
MVLKGKGTTIDASLDPTRTPTTGLVRDRRVVALFPAVDAKTAPCPRS